MNAYLNGCSNKHVLAERQKCRNLLVAVKIQIRKDLLLYVKVINCDFFTDLIGTISGLGTVVAI